MCVCVCVCVLPAGPGVLSFLQSRRQKARQSDSSPEGSQSRQPLHEAMAIPAGGGGGGGGREQEGEGGREEREESETMEQEQRGEGVQLCMCHLLLEKFSNHGPKM